MRVVFAFEEIGERLPLLPLAARRALDVAGRKLTLAAWRALPLAERRELTEAGAAEPVPVARVQALAAAAEPAADVIPARSEAHWRALPAEVAARGADAAAWAQLDSLSRFALAHLAARPQRHPMLSRALAELGLLSPEPPSHAKPIVAAQAAPSAAAGASPLSHLSPSGEARMVGVADKPVTRRRAVAAARVCMAPATAALIGEGAPKGDVLAVARIAGIQAAKRTPALIPLCHGIALTRVAVSFRVDVAAGLVQVEASAEALDRTGVEMEAMVAASVASLTIYDMLKAAQKDIVIEQLVLLEKEGGRSGHYRHVDAPGAAVAPGADAPDADATDTP